jgi:hypothetical protein
MLKLLIYRKYQINQNLKNYLKNLMLKLLDKYFI